MEKGFESLSWFLFDTLPTFPSPPCLSLTPEDTPVCIPDTAAHGGVVTLCLSETVFILPTFLPLGAHSMEMDFALVRLKH